MVNRWITYPHLRAFGKIRRVWNIIFRGRGSIWDTFASAVAAFRGKAFRIGTTARGAMLPSSFVPF